MEQNDWLHRLEDSVETISTYFAVHTSVNNIEVFPSSYLDQISHVASTSAIEISHKFGEETILVVDTQPLTTISTSREDQQVLRSTADYVPMLKDAEEDCEFRQ